MNESSDPTVATPPFRVVTRGLSAGELAAVTVVVDAAVQQELEALQSEPVVGPSAWERSQRGLRAPLHPGPGAWRSFSA
ncbi:acyl-CoA carboxylase epsilon subunit [Herbiconiux liangxiaofengii]|uniref:acyl-CoA carboxylase epsilon subunit n=1 Tax=Herbiconiux liangxiaofengii TaxID=3342795 RepID=UPI0035BACA2B